MPVPSSHVVLFYPSANVFTPVLLKSVFSKHNYYTEGLFLPTFSERKQNLVIFFYRRCILWRIVIIYSDMENLLSQSVKEELIGIISYSVTSNSLKRLLKSHNVKQA